MKRIRVTKDHLWQYLHSLREELIKIEEMCTDPKTAKFATQLIERLNKMLRKQPRK